MTSALDKPVHVTIFPDLEASTRESLFLSLREFAQQLRDARAPTKQQLRLFSMCSYSDKRTSKNSLRHDANVRECFALVGDYDSEQTSLSDAADALKQAGICALIATTPSYSNDRPRWRVITPLSDPLHHARPNAAGLNLSDYPKLVSRLAGIFPDALAAESWTLSQSWYLGGLDGAVDHGTLSIEGEHVDLHPELDTNARPKPSAAPRTRPQRPAINEQGPQPQNDASELVPVDVADALAAITAGTGAHDALVRLAGKFASQAVPMTTAEAVILNAVDQRPEAGRDAGWKKLRADVGRTVKWAYERFAEQEAQYTALIATAQPRPHSDNGTGAPPPPPRPPPPPPGAGPSPGMPSPQPAPTATARAMLRNRSPRFAGNVANVITLLLQAPQLAGCVAFDQMALTVELRQPLPGTPALSKPRPWTDTDTGHLQDFLQRECRMERVGRETVHQGVEIVARMNGFHPVRDFLNAQIWDGTPRISTWLTVYLGVTDAEYARVTGRLWLIGMVARVEQPGCRFEHLLILEGPQGSLKSQTARVLCDPWVSDRSLDIRNDPRAVSQHLRGVWLHELAELVFFRPADVEAIKVFISLTTEKYLPRFARSEVQEPRQLGFIGSTNREVYLHDATGGRRFWPHRVGKIDLEALNRDRNQLWAEALAAYRAGEQWWPDVEFEERAIQPEQAARFDEDGWTPLIADYLKGKTQVTLIEVFRKALADPHNPYQPELAPEKFDRRAQLRVREVLENLGWKRGDRTAAARWWVKPP